MVGARTSRPRSLRFTATFSHSPNVIDQHVLARRSVRQEEGRIADASTAFMQISEEISQQDRPKGALCFELPPGGIPLADGTWVEEGSIIQLYVAVYGLANDAQASIGKPAVSQLALRVLHLLFDFERWTSRSCTARYG